MSKDESLDYRYVCMNYKEDDSDDFPTDIVHGGKISASEDLEWEDIYDSVIDQLHAEGYEFEYMQMWDHSESH